jgi:signal peptidase I
VATLATSSENELSGASWASSAAQSAVRVLWLYIIPSLCSASVVHFLVPVAGSGFRGWVAAVAHGFPVLVLVTLFLFFSALAHYWRPYLPGGRYAMSLPANLAPAERDPEGLVRWAAISQSYDALSSKETKRRLEREATESATIAHGRRVASLRAAIEAGDLDGAASKVQLAEVAVAQILRARALRKAVTATVLAALGLLALFELRRRVAEPYEILSSSMVPTLERGDRVVANKTAYARGVPRRGDVIVFPSAAVALGAGVWPQILVKRVVGLPGDRVEMADGSPVINGWTVPYCEVGRVLYSVPDAQGSALAGRLRVEYLASRSYVVMVSAIPTGVNGGMTVARGQVFVLGDNRSNSIDSRAWNGAHGGGVPLGAIAGRVDWFLVGTHRSGDADFSRFLEPFARMESKLRLESLSGEDPGERLKRCLNERPAETVPP